jgi:TolA-binding protein
MSDRNRKGHFQAGCMPGPGRPRKGEVVIDTTSLDEIKAMVEAELPEMMRKAINLAKEGNIHALRMILDRVWPIASAQQEQLEEQIAQLRQEVEALTADLFQQEAA